MADWMDWPATGLRSRAIMALVIVGIGMCLGLVLAPAISAARALPPPIIERVPIYTAEVLDTGSACVYTWDGGVYFWSRAHLRIRIDERCPTRVLARTRYEESLDAPVIVPQ